MNWLVRQLKSAPAGVRVEAFVVNGRGSGATELLGKVREDPNTLVADPKRDIKTFRIALSAPMGTKRSTGKGSFIDSTLDLVDNFYGDVVQHLKAWTAAPPKLRDPVSVPDVAPVLSSTAISSQDGPEAPTSAQPS